jgi:hypothetical protein
MMRVAVLFVTLLLTAPVFAEEAPVPVDPSIITVIPKIILDPGERIQFAPGWTAGYVPEYKLTTITGDEDWPTILLDEYWVIFYGQRGTISSGEFFLMNLPQMEPHAGGKPLCRDPDGRVYESTERYCGEAPRVRRR